MIIMVTEVTEGIRPYIEWIKTGNAIITIHSFKLLINVKAESEGDEGKKKGVCVNPKGSYTLYTLGQSECWANTKESLIKRLKQC